MRVCLVVPGGFDRGERIIPALHALTRQLSLRHEVHVVAQDGPSGPGTYELAGAHVEQLARSGGARPSAWWTTQRTARLMRALARLHREARLDVLHAFWAGETGVAATLFGRWALVPVVVSVGGGEAVWLPDIGYGGAGSTAGRARTRLVLRLANAVTAGSVFCARTLPGDATAVQIVPLGAQRDAFASPGPRLPGPPWKLLQVADINPVKDQQTLLEAFALVVKRHADVTLDLVGEDTLGGRLQRWCADHGLGDKVRFHGFVPHDRLALFYAGAHLHVVSSRYESQGVAVLEAASAGLPTVGTAVGYLPTMTPDAAVTVATRNAPALAEAITSLLEDEPRRREIARAAQKLASEHDASSTARSFERIYTALR